MNQSDLAVATASPERKTRDVVGPLLASATAVLAVVVVGAHMYLASLGKTDATSTFLVSALALTFSTVCTIWVGRWSAHRENKAFIRAALRTTYGLHEGLEVAERSALEAISRMKASVVFQKSLYSSFVVSLSNHEHKLLKMLSPSTSSGRTEM